MRTFKVCVGGVQFSPDDAGSVTVQLGATRVLAVVTATLDAPFPDRC